MLEMHLPWHPMVRHEAAGPFLRGLTHVVQRGVPMGLDPSQALLQPLDSACHTVRRVTIPLGNQSTAGYFFVPKQASGATVCLVHGTGAEKIVSYYMWVRNLLAAGISVLTFDLDGHGHNPRPLTCPGIEENVPAALAFLRQQPEVDPSRMGLIGFSLGGACALDAAPREEGIRAVVTVSTPHRLAMDDWMRFSEVMGLFIPETLPTFLEASPNRLVDFVTVPIRFGPGETAIDDLLGPITMPMIHRAVRHLNPLDNAARLVSTPVLVINGEWDNVSPPWQARELYERIAGPKTLAMLPRRNHFTTMISRQAVDTMVHWFRRWL